MQCWAATGIQVSNRELEAQNAARQAAKAAAAAEELDAAWRAAARKVGSLLDAFSRASARACFWNNALVRVQPCPASALAIALLPPCQPVCHT